MSENSDITHKIVKNSKIIRYILEKDFYLVYSGSKLIPLKFTYNFIFN